MRLVAFWRTNLVFWAVVPLLLSGCGSQSVEQSRRVVTADDFATRTRPDEASPAGEPDDGDQNADQEERRSLLRGSSPTTVTIETQDARAEFDEVSVLVGPPVLRPLATGAEVSDAEISPEMQEIVDEARQRIESTADGTPTSQGGVVSSTPVDAVVGHINGRPLFASEFFESMDLRLRQQVQQLGTEEWLRFAQQQIAISLRDRIRDELLLAELEASMSQQERVGLLAFVQRLRTNLVSRNMGSSAIANEKILSEEGITLNEKVLQSRDEELVRYQLQRAIGGKTFVPWREVLQQFERDRDQYDVPPVARFTVIWADDDEDFRQINTRLITGDEFEAVASESELNAYPSLAGSYEVPLEQGEYSQTRLFGPDVLNEAALGLAPGETVGPVSWSSTSRTRNVWIKLEAIEDRSVDLYDVQLAIYDQLYAQRLNEAQGEYFTELITRGSLSDIEDMQKRLFRIATERYLITTLPKPAQDTK